MPQKTVLQVVSSLLNKLEFEEVTSIADTPESEDVARIVRSCYRDMLAETSQGHQGELIKLEAAATEAKPVIFKIPDSVELIEWINYTASPDATQNSDIAAAIAGT